MYDSGLSSKCQKKNEMQINCKSTPIIKRVFLSFTLTVTAHYSQKNGIKCIFEKVKDFFLKILRKSRSSQGILLIHKNVFVVLSLCASFINSVIHKAAASRLRGRLGLKEYSHGTKFFSPKFEPKLLIN